MPVFEKLRTLQQLRLLIRQCAANSESVVGKKANGIRLKPMKSQWGSCNYQGVIAINSRLMYLSERLVAYIVHHEVVHLKIHKHDKSFRDLVEVLFPDRRELDFQLKKFAILLRTNL